MHEYSLVQALLEQVEQVAEQNGAIEVHRIRLRLGELSGVEAGLLERAFEMARCGTRSAAAHLEVVSVAARWSCSRCERPIAPGAALRCSECGAPARLLEGDEIILERIEMDVS